VRILFVCLGNICRSPLLEAVARARFARAGRDWHVASCGTGGWHAGEGADPRAVRIGQERGYALQAHRARQLAAADYQHFDLLLAADADNLAELERRAPRDSAARVDLALRRAGLAAPLEVPDYTPGIQQAFLGVFLAGMIANLRPLPLLALLGNKGGGKSTLGRSIIRVIYGPSAGVTPLSDDPRDFWAMAKMRLCFALDNVDAET